MKSTLLATVAAVAVVGCTTLAMAQNAPTEGQPGKSPVQPQGAQQQPKGAPAGAMNRQQGNAQTTPGKTTLGQSGGQPAQGASPQSQQRLGQGQQDQNEATPQRGAQQEPGKSGANTGEQHTGQTTSQTQGSRGKSVELSQDQRTRISAIVGKGHAAHAANNVHFSVTVGAMVPRSVHVEVLPSDIVAIVPQYEGFDYIVVGDEILIVDPDTMEIVAVIPA
jgi:hypothetical protein